MTDYSIAQESKLHASNLTVYTFTWGFFSKRVEGQTGTATDAANDKL